MLKQVTEAIGILEDLRGYVKQKPPYQSVPSEIVQNRIVTEINKSLTILKEIDVKPSHIYNQALYIVACSFAQYLASPLDPAGSDYPEHWKKVVALNNTGNLYQFAGVIANEFERNHSGLEGDQFTETLDAFINQKLQAL